MRYQQTGERLLREFKKQKSLALALCELLNSFTGKGTKSGVTDMLIGKRPKSWGTAYFKSGHGDIPVTLQYAPPARSQVSTETMKQLDYFFEQFAAFGKEHGIEVWLAYMPCKERIVHGMVEFSKDAPDEQKQWEPTDLPQVISELAKGHDVGFIDFTPALAQGTKAHQELLFNTIYDSHLNARGSLVVAQELARFLSATNSPRAL